jgi:mono/diheme cytochrome c family protein
MDLRYVLAGVLGAVVLSASCAVPAGAEPASDPSLVARGRYLAKAADCMPCHTSTSGKSFAGGLKMNTPFGAIYSPNITPDRDTGIGTWTFEEFKQAVHSGIRADGKYLYPAMPFDAFTGISEDDLKALWAYFRSVPPVRRLNTENELSFPFNIRFGMLAWRMLFFREQWFVPETGKSAQWNRGAYLVEALGHCGDCHTPRNILFGLKSQQKFAGAIIQGWNAYNITPDPKWGIGAWSDSQIGDYLSHGHADGRGSASGPMAEVVDNSLRFLTDVDIRAMATYLKSVAAVSDAGGAAAVQTPSAQGQVAKTADLAAGSGSLGLHVFEGACASCHSFDGNGVIFSQASLLGTRSANDPTGTNATQAILQGTHLHTALGKVFMPGFGNGYSDAEIAAVVNFVTGRFGTSASALTPDEVAKRRQEN